MIWSHSTIQVKSGSEKRCDTALLISRPCYRRDLVGANAALHSSSSRLRSCQCKSTAIIERKVQPEDHDLSPPSFFAFCMMISAVYKPVAGQPTRAFIVPWRACLWFLRNFGSVPFKDGYLEVLGFLILSLEDFVRRNRGRDWKKLCLTLLVLPRTHFGEPSCFDYAANYSWTLLRGKLALKKTLDGLVRRSTKAERNTVNGTLHSKAV